MTPTDPTQSSEWLDAALVMFSKRMAMVQGEYNSNVRPLSEVQKHAEEAQQEAKQAILTKLKEAKVAARVDENRYWIDRAGVPITSTDLSNRISELSRQQTEGEQE